MNSSFDDREKGFEAKYRHDEEIQFKITARRNKLLGLWAADRMQITGADAEAYAREVVVSDFEEPGHDDVVRKVLADLDAKNVGVDELRLLKEMERLTGEAREQIFADAELDQPS